MILDVSIKKRDGSIWCARSASDVVIIKEQPTQALRLTVLVDGELRWELRGDGVVISTPAGAGEYASRVGGIWMDPLSDVVMITPICCHSIHASPLIVNKEREIVVYQSKCDCVRGKMMIDGKEVIAIRREEPITVVFRDTDKRK